MSNITWEEFLRCSRELMEISDVLGDGWSLEGDREVLGAAYLKKARFSRAEDGSPIRWEYNVCYDVAYSGPALYFNAWNASGSLLSTDQIWQHCNAIYKSDGPKEMFTAVTQREHPVTSRPFFAVHPCKTAELLLHGSNLLVRFISTVGPFVNLNMPNEYGLRFQSPTSPSSPLLSKR